MRAYLGVGTNLGDRWANLALAAREIRASGRAAVLRASRVHDNAPVGPPQPRYLNAVLEVETGLDPERLMALLLAVERAAGRVRGPSRWAARRLDLDLLLQGDLVVRRPGLEVPHPGIAGRAFVLAPLAELCPERVVPGTGRTVARLLAAAPPHDMREVGLYPL
ncbi:MAG TPA: 2-amino-4-hydroxy-6-hydroxymethyldihydropteridine diphosphokinase [Anaeromyxobacteraceae bacterium]|nr:2-amino-4-hydroxy-6-hydroxymethyldihydropteridine diphosphokinase [Anaeromyxobacteraceae bacterium]